MISATDFHFLFLQTIAFYESVNFYAIYDFSPLIGVLRVFFRTPSRLFETQKTPFQYLLYCSPQSLDCFYSVPLLFQFMI